MQLIEVRVNSLTWYSNSFNIYRTLSPHEMAAVFFFFTLKEIDISSVYVCMMMDAFTAVAEVH